MFAPHIQGIPLPTSKPTSEANQCNRNLRQTVEKAGSPWEKMSLVTSHDRLLAARIALHILHYCT